MGNISDKDKKILIITTLVCLLPILAGIVLYSQLPATIATHFNGQGVADGYSPKAFAVFGLPAILAVVNVIAHLAIVNDPKYPYASRILTNVSKWMCPVISLIINASMYLIALGYTW